MSRQFKLRNYSLTMTLLRDILTMNILRTNAFPWKNLKITGHVRHQELINLNLPYTFLRVNELDNPLRESHKHCYIVTDQPVIHNAAAVYTLEEIINSMQADAMSNFLKYIELNSQGERKKDNPYFLGSKDWEYRGARSKVELHKLEQEILADPDGHHVMDMQDAWHYCSLERRKDGWKLDPVFYWRREGLPLSYAFCDDIVLYGQAHSEGLILNSSYQEYWRTSDEVLDVFHRGEEWDLDPPQL